MVLDVCPAVEAHHFSTFVQYYQGRNPVNAETLLKVLDALLISVGNSTEWHIFVVSFKGLLVTIY